jgi:hypothetical protein
MINSDEKNLLNRRMKITKSKYQNLNFRSVQDISLIRITS